MLNKVTLIGRLGADPEIRSMTNGGSVANFNIATTENWKDKQTGEKVERTEWVRVVVFGKLAEIIQSYVKKGSMLYLEGKLQTRKWQDKTGADRYTTEVVIDFNGRMLMLDSKNSVRAQSEAPVSDTQSQPPQTSVEVDPDLDDDIPF